MVYDIFYQQLVREKNDTDSAIEQMEEKIAAFAKGTLVIQSKGKHRYFYRKSYQNGKVVSAYLGADLPEREEKTLRQACQDRKTLEKRLRLARKKSRILARTIRAFEKNLSI